MAKTMSIVFLLGAAFLLVAANDARCEAPTLLQWLQAAPAQWGPSGDVEGEEEDEGDSGGKKGELSLSGGLRMTMMGRHMHLTHFSSRPRQWPWGLFQHSQLDEDSEWYVTTQIGALRIEGEYPLMDKLTLRGTVLLGGMGSSVEYRIGTGNSYFSPARDTSIGFDTLTGWYPLDMFYGLEVSGTFELMKNFAAGARWSMGIGSAPTEEWGFLGSYEGWYTFFSNDFDVFAEYTTDYGTPWAGFGITLYEAWANMEDQTTGTPTDYKYHWRETQWFQIVLGYKVELKSGHFMGVRMALVGQSSFSMEAGYKFM